MSPSPIALGSGLAESAAPAAFLPKLCRHILGEELKMPTVATWWCGHPQALSYVTDNLSNLVIKPASPDHRHEPISARAERQATRTVN